MCNYLCAYVPLPPLKPQAKKLLAAAEVAATWVTPSG
jgi:hypothetical protein